MPQASIDGLKINYVVKGEGPPLIMLAPGGFDSNIDGWSTRGVWKDMRPLDALAKDRSDCRPQQHRRDDPSHERKPIRESARNGERFFRDLHEPAFEQGLPLGS